jgi:AcrR family transcriptional regulator
MTELQTSRPLRKDAARNRELLIAAAREAFVERGLEVSLDDIARHAGLGVGTAYRHFSNKHELIRAIAAQAYDELAALGERVLAIEDPWQALVGFFEGVLTELAESCGLREVFHSVHDEQDLAEIEERLIVSLETLLDRAIAAGAVRPDAAVTDLAVMIIMLSAVSDTAGSADPGLWRRYLPAVLAGLRPGAPAFGAPPIDSDTLRKGIREQKERLAGVSRKR